ncbi:sodium-dependent bicarbonate transport family permease [Aestuariirhabdus litorea]|uniref:Sodium-dependent bicarbonate transport family permease n=1 Tax=Aestuariirhabdus litorea TaxID=2528527 RepID=A0A3P3VPN0_9GAMM|nr:sodium-dependent bicarbonate transport family permease [Aestuariirhabdus litorea]RRJ84722.1 sodium-dependent bicarbonate transport family permease [Aestuariirhabdus litorea]RWW97947.1 sodium-dependent bicarbonate transport family permease [Endozoicomonadaceae bacterium GTF-13]
MQIDVVAAFFLFGAVAQLLRAPIKMPAGLYQTLTLFLLVAIGLKGGISLASHASIALLWQSLAVIAFGALLPFVAFPLLYYFGGLSRVDSASMAAHYGSVSIATFAVALALLDSSQVAYEPYFALFVALLEIPAIAVGLWLARSDNSAHNPNEVVREIFLNQGVLLLVGSLLIGFWAGSSADKLLPFFGTLFHGVLALFLLEMGRVAASRIGSLRQYGSFITCFGVVMPLIGATLGALLGLWLELSIGGTILMATLGGSASYIAVPAAMAVALPQANQSLSITASLSVTFPFNVLVGIPLYSALISHFMA